MRAQFLRQGGGGLRIASGNVQLTNCDIYSNTANWVSTWAHVRAGFQT